MIIICEYNFFLNEYDTNTLSNNYKLVFIYCECLKYRFSFSSNITETMRVIEVQT